MDQRTRDAAQRLRADRRERLLRAGGARRTTRRSGSRTMAAATSAAAAPRWARHRHVVTSAFGVFSPAIVVPAVDEGLVEDRAASRCCRRATTARRRRCGACSASPTRSSVARAVELLRRGLECRRAARATAILRGLKLAAVPRRAHRPALALLRHGARASRRQPHLRLDEGAGAADRDPAHVGAAAGHAAEDVLRDARLDRRSRWTRARRHAREGLGRWRRLHVGRPRLPRAASSPTPTRWRRRSSRRSAATSTS